MVAGGVSQLTVVGMVVWRAGAGWLLRVSLSWPVMLMQSSMPVTRDRDGRYFAHRWVAAGGVAQLAVGWRGRGQGRLGQQGEVRQCLDV